MHFLTLNFFSREGLTREWPVWTTFTITIGVSLAVFLGAMLPVFAPTPSNPCLMTWSVFFSFGKKLFFFSFFHFGMLGRMDGLAYSRVCWARHFVVDVEFIVDFGGFVDNVPNKPQRTYWAFMALAPCQNHSPTDVPHPSISLTCKCAIFPN